jgi:hypothetical protein
MKKFIIIACYLVSLPALGAMNNESLRENIIQINLAGGAVMRNFETERNDREALAVVLDLITGLSDELDKLDSLVKETINDFNTTKSLLGQAEYAVLTAINAVDQGVVKTPAQDQYKQAR